jgi:hypothetical protein
MQHLTKHGLLASAIACALVAYTGLVRASPRISCSEWKWTVPDTLTGPQRSRVYIESPEIILRRDSVILLGSPSIATDSNGHVVLVQEDDRGTPLFAGVRLSLAARQSGIAPSQPIALPDGIERMGILRAGQTDKGDVGVVFRGPDERADSLSPYSTVWTSVLQAHGWTKPVVLLRPTAGVLWSGSLISTVAHGASRDVISAPLVLWDSAQLLRLAPSGWTSRAVHVPHHSYSAIAEIVPDKVLLLARVATTTAFPNGALFISRSDDDGLTWNQTAVLPTGINAVPHHARLVRASQHTVALAWVDERKDSDSLSVVRLAQSSNSGSTWDIAVPLTIAGRPTDLRAISDARGRVHVVIDSPSVSGAAPRHLVWDGIRWHRSTPQTSAGSVVPTPNVAALGRDSVLLTWAMIRRDGTPPITMLSVGHVACTP